jgi:hypothetical protein
MRSKALVLLVVTLLSVACGIRPPSTPRPPTQPPPTQPPSNPGVATIGFFVHDLTTPTVGLSGAVATCAGFEPKAVNPNGTVHFDAPSGFQLDCVFTHDIYDLRNVSGVPGIDVEPIDVWMQRVTLPPPANGWAINGRLRLNGRQTVDDSGPRLVSVLHSMDLIGHGLVRGVDAVLPTLDMAARVGYHVIRAGFQLHIPSGTWLPGPTQNGWDIRSNPELFKAILRAGIERGLKWNVVALGIRGLDNNAENEQFDLLASMIRELGPEHFVQVVASNEVRDTGDNDDQEPSELERLINRVRSKVAEIAFYALTAYTGTEDLDIIKRYTTPWMHHVVMHGYRDGQVHDKIRHYFNNGYEGMGRTHHIWHDEPVGVGRLVSVTANKHQLGPAEMQLIAVAAAMRGTWTFMSGPGVVLGDEPWEAMPGLAETPAILRELPQDLQTFDIIGHSGPNQHHRIHAVQSNRPNVREDYVIDSRTGRYVAIQYGPPDQPKDLPSVRPTSEDRVLVDSPWGRVTVGRVH